MSKDSTLSAINLDCKLEQGDTIVKVERVSMMAPENVEQTTRRAKPHRPAQHRPPCQAARRHPRNAGVGGLHPARRRTESPYPKTHRWRASAASRRRTYPVKPEDEARLSPFGQEHINMPGRYSFSVPEAVARDELRPLSRKDDV